MRKANLFALATALSLAPAWAAAEPRAGVLPLDVEGKLPPNGAEALGNGIDEGLGSTGATVVPTSELDAAFEPPPDAGKPKTGKKTSKKKGSPLLACRDAECLKGLAAGVSAAWLVRPSVRMEDSDYVIALELVDGATGEVAQQVSRTCELCGLTEAQEAARELAASLREPIVAATMGTVTVSSSPAGAKVLVDGEPAGTTPTELRLAPGEHAIVLRLAGHVDEERQVTVETKGTSELAVELTKVAPAVAERRQRKVPLQPLGWSAIGLGVASLGAGIALLVLDENPVAFTRCSGPDVDAEGNCRFRHDTLVGGVVMTVVGVVGVTTGALLVARSRKQGDRGRDQQRARVRPTLRGLAIEF